LILEFARLVRELKPRYFVVENVRGLLYAYSRPILASFVRRIRLAGYDVVSPIKTLDASHFGVPQKRQRAFLLGYRKKLPAPEYPQPPMINEKTIKPPTVNDAIGDLPNLSEHDELLTSNVFTGKLGKASSYASVLRGDPAGASDLAYPRVRTVGGLGGCLRTVHTSETVERFRATEPGSYELKSRCYRLSLNGTAFTLRAGTLPAQGSFTAARPIHPTQPRCITTREAARLHSFPDWFEFHPTKWHGFRQVGNAVPPLFAKAVALKITEALGAGNDLA
jgi:DNA (cytosine-5)-methyltransferase 1